MYPDKLKQAQRILCLLVLDVVIVLGIIALLFVLTR